MPQEEVVILKPKRPVSYRDALRAAASASGYNHPLPTGDVEPAGASRILGTIVKEVYREGEAKGGREEGLTQAARAVVAYQDITHESFPVLNRVNQFLKK